jgi:hypothetical protein
MLWCRRCNQSASDSWRQIEGCFYNNTEHKTSICTFTVAPKLGRKEALAKIKLAKKSHLAERSLALKPPEMPASCA